MAIIRKITKSISAILLAIVLIFSSYGNYLKVYAADGNIDGGGNGDMNNPTTSNTNAVFEGKPKIDVYVKLINTDGKYYPKKTLANKEIDLPMGTTKTFNFPFTIPNYTEDDLNFTANINFTNKDNKQYSRVYQRSDCGDLYGEFLTPNSPYREGTYVVRTIMIYNDFER